MRRTREFVFTILFTLLIYYKVANLLTPKSNFPPPKIQSQQHSPMDSNDILHQFIFFNVYKDGKITVFAPPITKLPPNDDPITGVQIKDVQISSQLSARVFLPPTTTTTDTEKLPVLLYVHGGGFCMQSAFSTEYTGFLTRLVSEARIVAVSVEYGLFPDKPIPACYEDSWAALNWVAAHASGSGPDPWLTKHGDFNKLYIAGDSAGGNICHTLAARAGAHGLPGGVKLEGMVLVHPYFGEDDKMWMYMCPENEGPQDRRMKPAAEDLRRLGTGRVLVLVGEKDMLREAGIKYMEELKKSGWNGELEFMENKEREHCFHLSNPLDLEAVAIQHRITSFIHNQEKKD